MPISGDLGNRLREACETMGISLEEAFKRIDSRILENHEMHMMPTLTWIRLCDLLILDPDMTLHFYSKVLHQNAIRFKSRDKEFIPHLHSYQGDNEASFT